MLRFRECVCRLLFIYVDLALVFEDRGLKGSEVLGCGLGKERREGGDGWVFFVLR